MSKLSKFINHPEWFFQDAFKKRKKFLEKEIKKANRLLNSIGIPAKLDVNIIEGQIVDAALQIYQKGDISSKITAVNNIKNQIQIQKYFTGLTEKLQNLGQAMAQHKPHIVFKTSFEVSINPSQKEIKYIDSTHSGVDRAHDKIESLELMINQVDDKDDHTDDVNQISNNLSPRAHNLYLKLIKAHSHAPEGM